MHVLVARLMSCGDEREGRVEHYGRFRWPMTIHIGILLAHGMHLHVEATARTTDGQHHHNDENQRVQHIVRARWSVVAWSMILAHRVVVQKHQGCYHSHAEQPGLPIESDAAKQYGIKVALTAKLGKYQCRRAPPSELIIDDVGNVHRNAYGVQHDEHPLHHPLIATSLAQPQRHKLHDDAQHVDVAQCAQVKAHASDRHLHQVAKANFGKQAGIHIEERPPGQHVYGHDKQEIDGHDYARLTAHLLKRHHKPRLWSMTCSMNSRTAPSPPRVSQT